MTGARTSKEIPVRVSVISKERPLFLYRVYGRCWNRDKNNNQMRELRTFCTKVPQNTMGLYPGTGPNRNGVECEETGRHQQRDLCQW